MRLIAHTKDGKQAVIVHPDDNMYFYQYDYGKHSLVHYQSIEETDPVIVAPDNWVIANQDFADGSQVRDYLDCYASWAVSDVE